MIGISVSFSLLCVIKRNTILSLSVLMAYREWEKDGSLFIIFNSDLVSEIGLKNSKGEIEHVEPTIFYIK